MAQHPDVLSISGSAHHLGKSNGKTVLHSADRAYEVDQLSVDANYFETMELPLEKGRGFKDYEGSDRHSVIVNQHLVQTMAWDNPIGQLFKIGDVQYEVIGVVKDFHSYSFSKRVLPTIFTVAQKESYRYLALKVRRGSEVKTFKLLQAKWAELFPEIPFEGGHQEDVWGNYFVSIGIHGLVWRVFAFIAITMAGLGLYGLMTLNVAGRIKEFSIRKVLGACVKDITINISYPYTILFVVALTIGAPLSYLVAKLIIESTYPYHMPITVYGATISVTILVLVFLITVCIQVRRVAKANAVDGLKVE